MAEIGGKMEFYFGLMMPIVLMSFLIIAALQSPGYSPITHTISELGYFPAKTLFSIGFVISGALTIPYVIKLERQLEGIQERTRRIATGFGIFSGICISLIGIIPDENSWVLFMFFHMFSALIAFGGTSVYIVLFSYLMYLGPKNPMYKGPPFKKFMAYFGFGNFFLFLGLIIGRTSILEWMLLISTLTWQFIIAVYLLRYTFSGISGMYYKKTEYGEKLKEFQQSLQILEQLNLTDDPVAETLKKNIEYLKLSMGKDKIKKKN